MRMYDLIELAGRYCPNATLHGSDPDDVPYMAADMASAVRVFAIRRKGLGWFVQIDNLNVAFRVPSEEEAVTLAKVFTNVIELCMAAPMENLEGIQQRSIERLKELEAG